MRDRDESGKEKKRQNLSTIFFGLIANEREGRRVRSDAKFKSTNYANA